VLTTTSLATKPNNKAIENVQCPKPKGIKIIEINFPIFPNKLNSEAYSTPKGKEDNNQTIITAARIMVPAFLINILV